MADEGGEPTTDDLWADTNPTGTPAGPPNLPPTLPPAAPRTPPPGGTGGFPPGGPTGLPPSEPPGGPYADDGPPRWLAAAAVGLVVVLVAGLILVLVLGNVDDDSATTTTLAMTETTAVPTLAPTTVEELPTTDVATTVPPPETTIPTEAPASTEAPAPTSAAPPPAPDPGFARVDGSIYPLLTSCLVVPLAPNSGSFQISSYLVDATVGRLLLDRWADQDGQGLEAELVDDRRMLTPSALTGTDFLGPFSAVLTPADGGRPIDVAVTPAAGEPADCIDAIRTRDAANDEASQYTHAVVDVCTSRPEGDLLDVVGLGSQGARFTVIDAGGGAVRLSYSDRSRGPLVDPTASVSFDENVALYVGVVRGSGETLNIVIDVDLATPRACESFEAP
jgi:hypothetical protein